MQDITSVEHYHSARTAWFESIFELIVEDRGSPLPGLNMAARALMTLTFGGGHLLGFRDDELVLDRMQPVAVTQEISRWRSGRVHPRFARQWEDAWLTVFLYCRDSSAIEEPILAQLLVHPVGLHVQSGTPRDLGLQAREPDAIEWAIDRGQRFPIQPPFEGPQSVLDFGPNHLSVAANLLLHDWPEAARILLPLEAYAGTFDDANDLRLDRWLLNSRRIYKAFLAAPGSWTGSSYPGVPPHCTEFVLNRGGRQGHATTGVVPGWFATAESAGSLELLSSLAYGRAIAVNEETDSICLTITPLKRDDLTPEGTIIQYFYHRTLDDLTELRVLIAMRSILLEVLHLDRTNTLVNHAAFRIQLGDSAIEQLVAFAARDDETEALDYYPTSPEDEAMLRAMAAEMRRFELARVVRLQAEDRNFSEVGQATAEYLTALDRASALSRFGAEDSVYVELDEKRTRLRSMVNDQSLLKVDLGHEALSCLGERRALLHIEITVDGSLQPVASWISGDGSTRHKWFDCGLISPTLATSDTDWVMVLTALLAPIADIRADGVEHLVICPPSEFHHLPFHEALVSHFATVSYAPSLALLQPWLLNPDNELPAVIVGWPDTGRSYLKGVAAELEVVARLTGVESVDILPKSGAYRLLHLSGHADSGTNEAQSAIHLGPAGRISGTEVLREFRLNGTKLAVLSACSTGRMDYRPGQLLEAAPLDVCLQTVGVLCVVSTSRPVGDHVAFVFSSVLHAGLLEGRNMWDAFSLARTAARYLTRDPVPEWVRVQMDAAWPGWDEQGSTLELSDDWLAFRLGGRHWDWSK